MPIIGVKVTLVAIHDDGHREIILDESNPCTELGLDDTICQIKVALDDLKGE